RASSRQPRPARSRRRPGANDRGHRLDRRRIHQSIRSACAESIRVVPGEGTRSTHTGSLYVVLCRTNSKTPARRSQVSCARMAMLPGGQRATPWRTFVQAHWPALVAADFFTTEVWTTRGLVTYYTAFVIELHTRRVCVLGSTPNPDGAFVVQAVRGLLGESDAVLREGRILLCDR